MIIQEQISEMLIKTYSDKGVYIHGGYPEANYTEAVDPINMGRVYTETDQLIEDEEISNEEALNIIMGREHNETSGSNEIPEEH